MAIERKTVNWVTDDGSYGHGDVITFDPDDLSDRQHGIYDELDDDYKFDYLEAILNGDSTDEWENQ